MILKYIPLYKEAAALKDMHPLPIFDPRMHLLIYLLVIDAFISLCVMPFISE